MFDPMFARIRDYRTKVLQLMARLIKAPDTVVECAGCAVNVQSEHDKGSAKLAAVLCARLDSVVDFEEVNYTGLRAFAVREP